MPSSAGALTNSESPGGTCIKNWRTFGVSALAAFALSLLLTRPILEDQIVRGALATQNLTGVCGAWLLLIALLIATCRNTKNFLARSRRTWAFENPPLQYLHVAATCLVFASVGSLFSPLPRLSTEAIALITASGFSVAVWVVTTVIASGSRESKGSAYRQPPRFSLFPDDPISDDSEDCLHRDQFTDDLHKLIVTLPFKESFVISLNAPWGFGKTSTLRLLEKKLKSDSAIVLTKFDPWYFPTEEAMIAGFYGAIERALNANYLLHNVTPFFC